MPEKVNRFVISFAHASVLGHLIGLEGRITGIWRHFSENFFFFFFICYRDCLIKYRTDLDHFPRSTEESAEQETVK